MGFNVAEIDASIIAVMGEDFLYTPDGGSQVTIKGFFQSPDVDPDSGDLEFTTTGPMVTVLQADVPNPSSADALTRVADSQNYVIKEIETDEGTLVGLQLEETT